MSSDPASPPSRAAEGEAIDVAPESRAGDTATVAAETTSVPPPAPAPPPSTPPHRALPALEKPPPATLPPPPVLAFGALAAVLTLGVSAFTHRHFARLAECERVTTAAMTRSVDPHLSEEEAQRTFSAAAATCREANDVKKVQTLDSMKETLLVRARARREKQRLEEIVK